MKKMSLDLGFRTGLVHDPEVSGKHISQSINSEFLILNSELKTNAKEIDEYDELH